MFVICGNSSLMHQPSFLETNARLLWILMSKFWSERYSCYDALSSGLLDKNPDSKHHTSMFFFFFSPRKQNVTISVQDIAKSLVHWLCNDSEILTNTCVHQLSLRPFLPLFILSSIRFYSFDCILIYLNTLDALEKWKK